MKTLMIFAMLLVLTSSYSFAKTKATVVMGTKTVLVDTEGVEFVTCPEPTDKVCVTCPGTDDKDPGKKNNVGRFYNDPINPNIGTGYTDINVENKITPSGMAYYIIAVNPGNVMINNFQAWLDFFNLENPLLP